MGVLARVSTYLKLAVLLPAGMLTDVIVVRPVALSLNRPVPVLEVDRFTVSAVVVTLPNESSSWTVIVLDTNPAVSVSGVVVYTSWLAVAALTDSVCVAEVRPVAAAVRVGLLARVSTYLKLAVLLPDGMLTDVIVVRPVALSLNRPVLVFDVDRFTVSAVSLTLPNESSSSTVIVPDSTPAVSVCAVVVNISWLPAVAVMSKEFEVIPLSPGAVAVSVYPVAAVLMDRLGKVTTPLIACSVNVPFSVPLLRAMVTMVELSPVTT